MAHDERVSMTVHFEPEVIERVRELRKKHGIQQNFTINRAVREYLDRMDAQADPQREVAHA